MGGADRGGAVEIPDLGGDCSTRRARNQLGRENQCMVGYWRTALKLGSGGEGESPQGKVGGIAWKLPPQKSWRWGAL